MLYICKRFKFDAAHRLPHYNGPCKNLHGHTYFLDVKVSGPKQVEGPCKGMIMDFSILKTVIQENVISLYDHNDLNNFFSNPTAELMVEQIWYDIVGQLEFKGVVLEELRLWETPDSYAEMKRDLPGVVGPL